MSFWLYLWTGTELLGHKFRRLYNVAANKEATVADMGDQENGSWVWRGCWRRDLFQWEEQLLQELWNMVQQVQVKDSGADRWFWRLESSGVYSVKTSYKAIMQSGVVPADKFFSHVWSKLWPPKVAAFAWRVALDRIPMLVNLEKRGIGQVQGVPCTGCQLYRETTTHSFFEISFASKVRC